MNNLKILFHYGFKPEKPILMVRVALSYLRAWLKSGTSLPLHYIDFVTDYTCNLRCQHCFATSLVLPKKKKLTIGDYKRVAQEAMVLGVIHFNFQGGEPLLDKRLPKIIKAFKPWANYIAITTNGTLLTKKRILKLKKLGVDKLSISLDSGIAKEHDQFRGKAGTFKKAWQGMKIALENGLRVTINTTVSHQNLYSKGLKKLFSWAIKNKVIINPIFACPLGRWTDNLEILMTVDDRKYIDKLREKSAYIRRDMDSNWRRFGCPAVKEVLYITPYGDTLPCPFLHLSLGNIKSESLFTIRDRALKFKIFQRYHQQCLASEDREFIKKYLKAISSQRLPLAPKKAKRFLEKQ